MKRILLTASGGPSTTSFLRSLRDAPEDFYIVGTDAGKYNTFRSEADKTYLCPPAKHNEYIPFLKHIIKKESIQFLHSQPEVEIYVIGAHREEILNSGCLLFMPPQDTIEKLRDKWTSYTIWRDAGIKVPESVKINTTPDLIFAFEKFKREIWIRETVGAAGKGSLSRPTYQMAIDHIDARDGWGKFMAAEHLTNKTITWQSIWYEGDLVVGQGRKRLYWAFDNRAQSGVTGLTGTGVTVSDTYLTSIAIKSILAADQQPHGIYSVDLCFDWDGVPNPTEINIGKFFTTHHFITRAGCNMPYILVQLAFDEYHGVYEMLDPCQENLHWIRGIDVLPKLVTGEQVYEVEKEYSQNLEAVRGWRIDNPNWKFKVEKE